MLFVYHKSNHCYETLGPVKAIASVDFRKPEAPGAHL